MNPEHKNIAKGADVPERTIEEKIFDLEMQCASLNQRLEMCEAYICELIASGHGEKKEG